MTNQTWSESALGRAGRIGSGHDSRPEAIGTFTPTDRVDRVDPVTA